MKSAAEVMREMIDSISSQSQPAQSYDLELMVQNPDPMDPNDSDEQIDARPEEIKVGIDYTTDGKYMKTTFYSPVEYPEVYSITVTRLDTNLKIPFESLPKATQKYIIEHIYDIVHDTDPDDDRPDYRD